MLYGRARMRDHARKTFEEMHFFGCPWTVRSFNATEGLMRFRRLLMRPGLSLGLNLMVFHLI